MPGWFDCCMRHRPATAILDHMKKTYRSEFRERLGQWEWAVFLEGEHRPVMPWSKPYAAKAEAKADAEKAMRRLQWRDSVLGTVSMPRH